MQKVFKQEKFTHLTVKENNIWQWVNYTLYIYIYASSFSTLSNLSHFVFSLIQNEARLKSVELEDLKEQSSGLDQISCF